MKKHLLLLILTGLLFTHGAFAGFYNMSALNRALVAHYKANDNAANTTVVDDKGTYNMTSTVNTSTITTTGIVNQAFDLSSGSGRRASIADQNSLRLDEFSVAVWLKRTNNHLQRNVEAESNLDTKGTSVSYGGATCMQALASSGAGYAMTYNMPTTDVGGIFLYPRIQIHVKPGTNTQVCRLEIYDTATSSIIYQDDAMSNDFAAIDTWYAGYSVANSITQWFTGISTYQIRIYSYGNVDFWVDYMTYDVYHNSAFGKGNDWAFWYTGNSFRVTTKNGGTLTTVEQTGTVPTKDAWTFVVGTFSKANKELKFYQNGTLKGTQTLANNAAINWSTQPIYLGSKGTGANEQTYGLVDNGMIFNKVLTQNEINILYNSGNGTELVT